jgi:hypothetical protein
MRTYSVEPKGVSRQTNNEVSNHITLNIPDGVSGNEAVRALERLKMALLRQERG